MGRPLTPTSQFKAPSSFVANVTLLTFHLAVLKSSLADPPHSVQISVPQIDLLEGEKYPEKPVQCSAFGNPAPTYYWTFSPIFAENKEGSASPANRQSKPSDAQSVVALGPQLMLNLTTMTSRLSPHDLRPKQAEEGAKAGARVSPDSQTSTAGVSPSGPSLFRASRVQSGNYTCVSRNEHGISSATMTINVFCKWSPGHLTSHLSPSCRPTRV